MSPPGRHAVLKCATPNNSVHGFQLHSKFSVLGRMQSGAPLKAPEPRLRCFSWPVTLFTLVWAPLVHDSKLFFIPPTN